MPVFREAVVICTRNRADDLRRTLESITQQEARPLVVVVDASDAATAEVNRTSLNRLLPEAGRHMVYPDPPSSARQRNFGLERLPASVEVVHFLDDDVTLRPQYLRRLSHALRQNPDLGGVGGIISVPGVLRSRRAPLMAKLFLLDHAAPGRVLSSGRTSSPPTSIEHGVTQREKSNEHLLSAHWLSGCSSYRRVAFDDFRFDTALSGYAMLEDLDFSYRVGQSWKLALVPSAHLLHHVSSTNRYEAARYARTGTIHRYWFVEKNFRHPLRKLAFWWATLGEALARLTSRRAGAGPSLHGLWQGVCAIWRRDHPLLQRDRQ